MKDQNVGKEMQKRVINYHNYIWARNRGKDVKLLFQDAPYCLQAEVYMDIMRDMLENVSTATMLAVCLVKISNTQSNSHDSSC